MKLDSQVFKIDANDVVSRLEEHIRAQMSSLRRSGIVVPLSGGLDSTTVLALCVRAVGTEKVTALLLPERKGSLKSVQYANLAARHFKVRTEKKDISKTLKAIGAYDFIMNKMPNGKMTASLVKKFLSHMSLNPFLEVIRGTENVFYREAVASMFARQRVRLAAVYLYAEEKNLLVCGSAHLSEDMVGLYVKFGVDDVADIMPLRKLYRSQVLQIASYAGVPKEILERSPDPEMLAGIEDKYRDVLGIDSANVDLILYGLSKQMSTEEIAEQLNVPLEKVHLVEELTKLTEHMRAPYL